MANALTCSPFRGWTPAEYPSATRAITPSPSMNDGIQSSNYWWRDRVKPRLQHLVRLQHGWDGHNGKPVKAANASYALAVLGALMREHIPAPSIVPLSNGSVQLEWHCRGWDIEIEICGTFGVQAWAHEVSTGEETETEVTSDLSEVLPLLLKIA